MRFHRGAVILAIDPPADGIREILWRRALGADAAADLLDWSAARYALSPGRILEAGEATRSLTKAREVAGAQPMRRARTSTPLCVLCSIAACRRSGCGSRGVKWSDFVLPEETLLEVRELISRVAHRRRVHDEWGFADKVGKGLGLTALFAGEPGTGKTMVAGLIADELGLDLYQVDLSRIVSKWVGETEKNLASLFDAAEAGHAILLFDEADSLFAKRTDVTSSVDRYGTWK